jgi:hypothetical protein
MNMAIDWTDLFYAYKGEWVALRDDEKTVVAHGLDAHDVWEQARTMVTKPILVQVPTEVVAYVG